jgi:hypothetical protein
VARFEVRVDARRPGSGAHTLEVITEWEAAMIVSLVIALFVVVMVASWLIDRRRRRRNIVRAEQGLVSADEFRRVAGPGRSLDGEAGMAEAAFREIRHDH